MCTPPNTARCGDRFASGQQRIGPREQRSGGDSIVPTGNLAELLAEQAAEAGWLDKPALYAPHVVTHGEIHSSAARLGAVLRDRGICTGDRILLCLPDSPELVELLLACLARGIVAVPANPESHHDDHTFQERDIEPSLVVTTAALRERFR